MFVAFRYVSSRGLEAGDELAGYLIIGAGFAGSVLGVGATLLLLGYRFRSGETQTAPDSLGADDEVGALDSNGEMDDERDKLGPSEDVAGEGERRSSSTGNSLFDRWRPGISVAGFGMLVIVIINAIATHRYKAAVLALIPAVIFIVQAVIWLRRRRRRRVRRVPVKRKGM